MCINNMINRGLIFRIRVWFYFLRKGFKEKSILNRVIHFTKTIEGSEYKSEGEFLERFGLTVFPYPFSIECLEKEIEIQYENDFPFINYFDKKLFFPKNYKNSRIINYAKSIIMEQSVGSPHRYKTNLFQVEEGDIVFDIGSAEGNFSLEHIENAKFFHLFEMNPNWEESINMTFLPWKNKVKLHLSTLGSINSIDPYKLICSKEDSVFFKIDVDGSEREVLKCIEPILLQNREVKVAICTYHKNIDAEYFQFIFESMGFTTVFSNGYMLFYQDKSLDKPYFRKGVLFAYKHIISTD